MSNIKSTDLKVFPSSGRSPEQQLSARLLTEDNITGIVRGLSNSASFVVSQTVPSTKGESFYFFLGGYSFEVEMQSLKAVLTETGYLEAKLQFSDQDDADLGSVLRVDDSEAPNAVFEGVEFTSTTTYSSPSSTTLCLLYRDGGGTFLIPEDSKVRLKTNATDRFITIDDGDLDAT